MTDPFIEQVYETYTPKHQETWRRLYARQLPMWERFANTRFLKGIKILSLPSNRIPRLEEINQFLAPITGFKARAVSGYVDAPTFFNSLKRREFPTTVTIRDANKLGYLPEPDIFHDIAGHVPMHTDPKFADTLAHLGLLGKELGEVDAVSRFFWFTIEFGLIREEGELRAYGSGLLSSINELENAILSPDVERLPFNLDRVVAQPFEIDRMQPLLFVIDSFDQLFEEVKKLG